MNCKQGDLAYVAELIQAGDDEDPTAKGFVDIRGTLVRCAQLVDGNKWLLERPVEAAWTITGKKIGFMAGYVTLITLGDEYLRPIRDPGDDAVDEMLVDLPSRQEVAA